MAENEQMQPVTVLENANVAIGAARKSIQNLCHEWTGMHQTAKEIARFDLCSALVRRLELAEREIVELVEMIK
jgi:hypothetical protein